MKTVKKEQSMKRFSIILMSLIICMTCIGQNQAYAAGPKKDITSVVKAYSNKKGFETFSMGMWWTTLLGGEDVRELKKMNIKSIATLEADLSEASEKDVRNFKQDLSSAISSYEKLMEMNDEGEITGIYVMMKNENIIRSVVIASEDKDEIDLVAFKCDMDKKYLQELIEEEM